MLTLVCALVGVQGSAFSVKIGRSESVGDLKKAIKKKKESDLKAVNADKLLLYLARKGDDMWLDRDGAEAVTLDEHGHLKGFAYMEGLNWILDYYGEEFQPKQGEIHVLVVVPTEDVGVSALSQPSFVWKEPKSLVTTTGADRDFQLSLDLGNLAFVIGRHYQAWRDGKTDERSHPLFMCLDAPGSGKSRLLDEFPNVLQQQIFCDKTQCDPAMKQLLREAFIFKISLENGTTNPGNFANPSQAIGTRMLFQLQDSVGWELFLSNRANHVVPAQVLMKLSAINGIDLSQMCVILCIDSLQELQHEPGSKHSAFYSVFSSLCDLVNASKCWVIAICSTTNTQPVDEFLTTSSQWREMLQTT